MLHKRFKPGKCKTSLKLATSRIKLMRNKKGVQINQMKRDLAQLLETGQDRTARIRVEHVIREEKMVAAYDLIEIYCELIVARLSIIESQKTCPLDLKEAITSVIFAAPRCSDISELSDIRKQFTAKYGKDFVSAAIELHPDCGVSRMLVEKLSAVAPDLQTKIKVLTAVAKDHNIDWDPTSFEEKESKPPSDLLNGPGNFVDASVANVDPPKSQTVHIHEEQQNVPFDFYEQNRKYTQSTQNVTSTDGGGEASSSVERMEMRHNWNMEFKDATSAAQAAAEAAERAAVAARAAAQFSSHEKIAGEHSTGPHMASSRDKHPHVPAPSGSRDESSLDDKKPKIFDQHIDQSQHHLSRNPTERLDTYNNDSVEDEKLSNSFHTTGGYFEESLHEDQEGLSSPKRESKTELADRHEESVKNEMVNLFATKKQSTIHSSHSSTSSDELAVGRKSVVGNPFAVVDQESPFKEASKTSPIVNDESVSDDDGDGGGPKFDTGFEYDETESSHSLENDYIWNPKMKTVDQPISQSHIFSESTSFGDLYVKSTEHLKTDSHGPATFDHSDGPDSESENELLSMNPEPSSAVGSTQTSTSRKSRIELDDVVQDSPDTFEDSNDSLNQGLNFGPLTGGLRNKGGSIWYPPYTKTATIEKSNSTDESSITGSRASPQGSLDSRLSITEDIKPKVSRPFSDSDSDEKVKKQANTRHVFSPPAAFFDDDDGSDFEVEAPKPVSNKFHLGSGLSRRTRGSPSAPNSKTRVESKPVIDTETQAYARRFKEEDGKQISQQQQPFTAAEIGQTKSTTFETQGNHSEHGKQEALKNTMNERVSSRIPVEPGKAKDAKTQNLGSGADNLVKKPSHVHPKLPDYDSLASRLGSLRTDHRQ